MNVTLGRIGGHCGWCFRRYRRRLCGLARRERGEGSLDRTRYEAPGEYTKLAQQKGVARGYQMDVTDIAAIGATVSQVRKDLGEIDILVVTAPGFCYPRQPRKSPRQSGIRALPLMPGVASSVIRRWLPSP